tara:strand:+ start:1525 stop:1854 length:330 start_codon:yes stop_codon:yes gene_type:complete
MQNRFSQKPDEEPEESQPSAKKQKFMHISSLDELPPEILEELEASKSNILKMIGIPEEEACGPNRNLYDYIAFQNVQISHLQKEIKTLLQEFIPGLAAMIEAKADRVTW